MAARRIDHHDRTAFRTVRAFTCDSAAGVAGALRQAMVADGPVLVHALIRPGSLEKLGRPTIAPHEVAQRFRGFLARSNQAAD